MVELTREEKRVKDSAYISEVPAGGIIEIQYKGKTLVKREGNKEIERIKE